MFFEIIVGKMLLGISFFRTFAIGMYGRKIAFALLLVAGSLTVNAQIDDLPRTSPEAVGMKSEQVSAFFDSLLAYPRTEIHSAIVMRHGRVVGEMYPAPFAPEFPHTQFSCSKTFVAAAVGIAIEEKLLSLDSRLVTFFPEQTPKIISWQLAGVTVADLLTMRSGFVVDTKMRNNSSQWIRDYMAHPMNAYPGKLFQYDSIDTYLLSAIVQKATGKTLLDYLNEKLFRPLNIYNVKWELSPEGICTGGWGLYIQAESLAKFGQLLLQRGRWHGHQLIPANWVDDMMTLHAKNSKGEGYGYQMWMCDYPKAACANGVYGQYIVVVPTQDVVVVINQCTLSAGKKELAYIWNTLFKDMRNSSYNPSESYAQLKQRVYSLPLLEGDSTTTQLNDMIGKTYQLSDNPLGWENLRFHTIDSIEIADTAGRKSMVALGFQTWKTSPLNSYPLNARYRVKNQFSTINMPFHVSACYAWRDEELQMKIHYVDWMASVLLKMNFEDDNIRIVAAENYQQNPITFQGKVL